MSKEIVQTELDKKVSEFINVLRQAGLADKNYAHTNYSEQHCELIFYNGIYNKKIVITNTTSTQTINQCIDILKKFYDDPLDGILPKYPPDTKGQTYVEDDGKFKQTNEQDKALRYNEGKTKWSYLPMAQLEDLVKVLDYGATKYTKDNWKKGEYVSRITDSLMRHILAYCFEGEDIDSESGLNHIGHILANVVFLKYNQGHPTFDDRTKINEVYVKYGYDTGSHSNIATMPLNDLINKEKQNEN